METLPQTIESKITTLMETAGTEVMQYKEQAIGFAKKHPVVAAFIVYLVIDAFGRRK